MNTINIITCKVVILGKICFQWLRNISFLRNKAAFDIGVLQAVHSFVSVYYIIKAQSIILGLMEVTFIQINGQDFIKGR